MPAFEGPDVVLQLAKTAVDDLAMGHLRHLTTRIGRSSTATIDGAECRLRWTRPTLTFPPDAPEHVRMGIAIEGGVRLPSGRLLSLDAFVTSAMPPRLTQDDSGWFARFALETPDIGEIQLTYAGQPLPQDATGMALGLPTAAELDHLRAGLRDAIQRLCETIPDLPLTPSVRLGVPNPVIHAYIWPDSQGAALAFGVHPTTEGANGALPLRVTPRQTVALLLSVAPLQAALTEAAAAAMPTLPPPFALESLAVAYTDQEIRFTLTARAIGDLVGEPMTVEVVTHPTIDGGVLELDLIRVTPPAGATDGTEKIAVAVQSAAFTQALTAIVRSAIARTLGGVFATDQPVVSLDADAPTGLFTVADVHLGDGYLTLSGTLPGVDEATDPVVDGPTFDLRLTDLVKASASQRPLTLAISVVNQQQVEQPADYAWWTSLDAALRAEHGALLDVRVPEDDPGDTLPRKTRSVPQGVLEVQAALIDAWGRVARAVLEIDLRGDVNVKTLADSYATADLVQMPTDAEKALAADTLILDEAANVPGNSAPQVALSRMGTRLNATTFRPTMVLPLPQSPAHSSLLGMFAGALAMFAVFAALAAIILAHTLNPTTTPPAPTGTAVAQATYTPIVTPTVATTTTPGATLTPQPFGRFGVTPGGLQFACTTAQPPSASTPTPTPAPLAAQTLTLTNTGTAQVKWTVSQNAPAWGNFAPATGTLKPGANVTITVTPNSDLCSLPANSGLYLQFNAPNVLSLTVSVTVTHS